MLLSCHLSIIVIIIKGVCFFFSCNLARWCCFVNFRWFLDSILSQFFLLFTLLVNIPSFQRFFFPARFIVFFLFGGGFFLFFFVCVCVCMYVSFDGFCCCC